jgi:hypothetical protein
MILSFGLEFRFLGAEFQGLRLACPAFTSPFGNRFTRNSNPKTAFARCTFLGDEWLVALVSNF